MSILDALDWLSRGRPDGVPVRWLWMACAEDGHARTELWSLIDRGMVEFTTERDVRVRRVR